MGAGTPVIVGVGQLANKDDDRVVHPLDLIESAVRLAVADSGAGLLDHVGWVGCPPVTVLTHDDVPAMLAERLGLSPGARHLSAYSGAAPQELVARACQEIADGRIEAALIAGGIADASVRRARTRGEEPPGLPTATWSQGSGVALPEGVTLERMPGARGERAAGVGEPVAFFSLVESMLMAAAGRGPDQQRAWLGGLMAPFTEVAARRPDLAWFPVARTPAELAEVRPDNRMVAGPYTKLVTAFPTVDLAAAVLVASAELADRLGVPADRRIHPWSAAACHEPHALSERVHPDRPDAIVAAADRALAAAGLGPDDLDLVDLYSCFPAAVQLGAAALGLPLDGSRALTVTGGLPYFGGPGASYTAHAIVTMVEECRARPGAVGAVLGLGGMISGFAVGTYSTAPAERPFAFDDCADVEARLDGERVELDLSATGPAVVLAQTIVYRKDEGAVNAPVLVRLPDGPLGRPASRPGPAGRPRLHEPRRHRGAPHQ